MFLQEQQYQLGGGKNGTDIWANTKFVWSDEDTEKYFPLYLEHKPLHPYRKTLTYQLKLLKINNDFVAWRFCDQVRNFKTCFFIIRVKKKIEVHHTYNWDNMTYITFMSI